MGGYTLAYLKGRSGNALDQLSLCWKDCGISDCSTTGGNADGRECKFPFIYKGVTYNTCTSVDNNNQPWCYTDGRTDELPNYTGEGDWMWGNCPTSCQASWTSWTEWTQCSASCGSGSRLRTRACNGDSSLCVGDLTETEACETTDCPGAF